MKNLYRNLESDQCKQVLPFVGSWDVNLVLFCFDGGQVLQRCLASKFMSSTKCFGLLPQVHAQRIESLFWLSQSSRSLQSRKEKHKVNHVLNKMLWPFTTSAHKAQALSGSNFFPLTEKASYILLSVSQWKPRAEQEPFAPNWFASTGLALVWSTPVLASVKGCWRGLLMNYMHQLLLPKLVKVTLGRIFVKELCYNSGNHGSIWANICSSSKTTKLVQISIGLPERASKTMQLLKEPAFYVNAN